MAKRSQLREQQAKLEPTIRAALPPGSIFLPAFGVTASISTSPTDKITRSGGSRRLAREANQYSRRSRQPELHRAQRRRSPSLDRISSPVKPASSSMDPA